MFGFRAGCQDKLPLPAGPNHCLLSAQLSACLPEPRPGLPQTRCCPAHLGVGTELPWLLLVGRGPEVIGCPVSEAGPGVSACLLGDQAPGAGGVEGPEPSC